MTYLLTLSRRLVAANEFVRAGAWPKGPFAPGRSTRGRRLGLLGLGRIGNAIARRAAAFDMPVGYHSRNRKESPLQFFASALELARWADVLIAAVPGGDETRHMVDRNVLRALGKDGLFINVARG